ncbi:hypothetical protein FVE85_4122 [Porphyridium purpureum]|uniref:Uncharacterized protein n=1 Tax=Porphyridium purpureum TaxID=35688 RepID=A0A5J4YUR2_PORPP|nr:hypothetical protein FVE85_4122 [Porphyridium purpureum]|eukprot:POR1461..scf229_5
MNGRNDIPRTKVEPAVAGSAVRGGDAAPHGRVGTRPDIMFGLEGISAAAHARAERERRRNEVAHPKIEPPVLTGVRHVLEGQKDILRTQEQMLGGQEAVLQLLHSFTDEFRKSSNASSPPQPAPAAASQVCCRHHVAALEEQLSYYKAKAHAFEQQLAERERQVTDLKVQLQDLEMRTNPLRELFTKQSMGRSDASCFDANGSSASMRPLEHVLWASMSPKAVPLDIPPQQVGQKQKRAKNEVLRERLEMSMAQRAAHSVPQQTDAAKTEHGVADVSPTRKKARTSETRDSPSNDSKSSAATAKAAPAHSPTSDRECAPHASLAESMPSSRPEQSSPIEQERPVQPSVVASSRNHADAADAHGGERIIFTRNPLTNELELAVESGPIALD